MLGTGIALSPIIGIASTQLSLQTGLGQLDSFEKACEQGPQKEGDVYSKVCDANGDFSYEMFQNSDLQRDINSTDIKTMMCGDKDADSIECGSYQAGAIIASATLTYGIYKFGKWINSNNKPVFDNSFESTPVGSQQTPLGSVSGNLPKNINGVKFTGHALDQMQARGILSPTAVIETVKNPSVVLPGNTPGTTVYIGNGLKVVTNLSGDIVTVIWH